jgi:glycosyltransferase involved in cell wall biosynthesis
MAYISIVIPTYNRAHCVGAAIESVLKQTFTDVEILIVDDGSTDDTARVVEKYIALARAQQRTLRYLPQTHQGKSVALNNVLPYIGSEWTAFLDSDDAWLPEKLEQQFRALRRFPDCQVCFTDYHCINNRQMDTTGFRFCGKSFRQHFGRLNRAAESILDSPFVSIVTLICRSHLIAEVGAFDPLLRFTEDYDFLFRLALGRDFCFVNAPLVLVDRSTPTIRHTGTSTIWDDIEFRLECEQYRYEKWMSMGDALPDRIRKKLIRKLRAVHSSCANEYLQSGKYDKAVQSIGKAVSYQVTPNLIAKWLATRLFPTVARSFALRRRGFRAEYF